MYNAVAETRGGDEARFGVEDAEGAVGADFLHPPIMGPISSRRPVA